MQNCCMCRTAGIAFNSPKKVWFAEMGDILYNEWLLSKLVIWISAANPVALPPIACLNPVVMATAISITATLSAMPKTLIDTINPVDFLCEPPFSRRRAIYNSVFKNLTIFLMAKVKKYYLWNDNWSKKF